MRHRGEDGQAFVEALARAMRSPTRLRRDLPDDVAQRKAAEAVAAVLDALDARPAADHATARSSGQPSVRR
jgi:hypothetical protein